MPKEVQSFRLSCMKTCSDWWCECICLVSRFRPRGARDIAKQHYPGRVRFRLHTYRNWGQLRPEFKGTVGKVEEVVANDDCDLECLSADGKYFLFRPSATNLSSGFSEALKFERSIRLHEPEHGRILSCDGVFFR